MTIIAMIDDALNWNMNIPFMDWKYVFNLLRLSDTYMCVCQWTGLSMVWIIMACRMFSPKSLPVQMLTGPSGTTSVMIWKKISFRKILFKMLSAKCLPFCLRHSMLNGIKLILINVGYKVRSFSNIPIQWQASIENNILICLGIVRWSSLVNEYWISFYIDRLPLSHWYNKQPSCRLWHYVFIKS